MTKVFVLLLTQWSVEAPIAHVEVIDHGMSGSDCIKAMISLEEYADTRGGVLSCEFDYGHEKEH